MARAWSDSACALSTPTAWLASIPTRMSSGPFYPNFGIIFFPRSIFQIFAGKYLYFRPKVAERLPDPYFSGQVALALAIAEMGTSTWALPMRFNFPNDTSAVSRYPDELDHVAVFHYLRTETFDRARIFANAAEYDRFLDAPLEGVNRVFQQYVRKYSALLPVRGCARE